MAMNIERVSFLIERKIILFLYFMRILRQYSVYCKGRVIRVFIFLSLII